MLNKNQSKKWNAWKYALVLPALTAFMFLFQIEVIAQKNTTVSAKNVTVTADLINHIYSVSKTTTNQALDSEKKLLKNKFNTDVTFSEIKRNSKNEITAIKVEITTPNKEKNIFVYSDNLPITEFQIFAGKLKNKETVVGLYVLKPSNGNPKNNKWKQTISYTIPPPPPPMAKITIIAPPPPPTMKNTTTPPPPPKVSTVKFTPPKKIQQTPFPTDNNKTISINKPMIIIDGVKTESKITINDLNSDAVKSMNVLKDEFAIKKYGEDGKNDVIEITTKENIPIFKESPKKD